VILNFVTSFGGTSLRNKCDDRIYDGIVEIEFHNQIYDDKLVPGKLVKMLTEFLASSPKPFGLVSGKALDDLIDCYKEF
jgi:hypothetical protein